MAIVFDWYENPNASSEEEAALHPRIFMNGKVDTDTLCYKIHDYSSLTAGKMGKIYCITLQFFHFLLITEKIFYPIFLPGTHRSCRIWNNGL